MPAGQGWLSVSPASGASNAAGVRPSVSVSVNGTGLSPGLHYGLVQVNAPGAANSPQVLTVFVNVLPAGSDTAAVVDPGSMQFTAPVGGQSPGSQTFLAYNITATAKSFRSTVAA